VSRFCKAFLDSQKGDIAYEGTSFSTGLDDAFTHPGCGGCAGYGGADYFSDPSEKRACEPDESERNGT